MYRALLFPVEWGSILLIFTLFLHTRSAYEGFIDWKCHAGSPHWMSVIITATLH